MSTAATSCTLPAPRCRAADAGPDLAALRAATYIEFLLGHGEAPGVDLGSPVAFERDGTVYSQRFARGLTLANVGPETVEVCLDRPYHDLTGALRICVTLAANSAEVLLSALPQLPIVERRHQVDGAGAVAHDQRSIPVARETRAAS